MQATVMWRHTFWGDPERFCGSLFLIGFPTKGAAEAAVRWLGLDPTTTTVKNTPTTPWGIGATVGRAEAERLKGLLEPVRIDEGKCPFPGCREPLADHEIDDVAHSIDWAVDKKVDLPLLTGPVLPGFPE